ncbi:endonuclease domain-containing 1 protein-like isoform X1 [Hemibagrus wyckioides]|uniref:endonuclease domain-containing 1 protein-like isoform X1 n=2 Tax=Hemibagrus wyckioides TaxID=337641 RepID=UPI00266C6B89|nr:endonuclease domain-containing 1 protein-like isoform X1 [Hemibagrus wyckioides]
MKLLTLVLLFFSFSSLSLTEVVNSFKQSCPNFCIRNPKKPSDIIIPTIFSGDQYKMIYLRWKTEYRFATVYDTERRIPVYSAYTFSGKVKTNRINVWKIEPQLENIKEYKSLKEMIDSPREAGKIFNQAVDSYYKDIKYIEVITRGHVFPYQFAADQDQSDSTFTLTNVAPQSNVSNHKWGKQVEDQMLKEIKESSTLKQNHQAYIVTRVVPGENRISITTNGKVIEKGINIPSHFWSAFYCMNKTHPNIRTVKTYLAEQENFKLRHPSIYNLNKQLSDLYDLKNKKTNMKETFSVFPGLDLK